MQTTAYLQCFFFFAFICRKTIVRHGWLKNRQLMSTFKTVLMRLSFKYIWGVHRSRFLCYITLLLYWKISKKLKKKKSVWEWTELIYAYFCVRKKCLYILVKWKRHNFKYCPSEATAFVHLSEICRYHPNKFFLYSIQLLSHNSISSKRPALVIVLNLLKKLAMCEHPLCRRPAM